MRYSRLAALTLISSLLTLPGTVLAAQPSNLITIAGPANDNGGEIFYANDLGMFKKAGLNVTVTVVNNAGTLSAAVASGAVTVGSLTVSSIAIANDKNVPLRIIAPAALYLSSQPTTGLIVLKDGPIHDAADLNGKTIGTRSIDNLAVYSTRVWLDRNGGNGKSVKFIEVPEPQAIGLMQKGRIDAADLAEPEISTALQGDGRLLAPVYNVMGKRFLPDIYFTSESYARAHPDVIRKLYDVILAAGKWANTHQAASAKILEKYTESPVPADIPRVRYAEDLRATDMQPVLDLLYKFNVIKKPVQASKIIASALRR